MLTAPRGGSTAAIESGGRGAIDLSARFVTNVALTLAGAGVVVASQALSSAATAWLIYGVALGVQAVVGISQLELARPPAQRLIDVFTAGLAVWAATAAVTSVGDGIAWLPVAQAIGFVGLGLAGLALQADGASHR